MVNPTNEKSATQAKIEEAIEAMSEVESIDVEVVLDESSGNPLPEHKSDWAAGIDLHANIEEPILINPGQNAVLIGTGVRLGNNDPEVFFLMLPRSGMGHKNGLSFGNTAGVIDADYTGEIKVSVYIKPGYPCLTINPGDRIAQLICVPKIKINLVPVEELSLATNRGASGFGSTGVGK